MSTLDSIIASVDKIKTYRNTIRSKLVSMGIGTSTDSMKTCSENISIIVDNTKKTTTSTAVLYPYYTGSGGSIYGKGNAGYNSAETMVRIPVTNLTPGNIKKGVNIGGVIGTLEPMPDEMSYTADGMIPAYPLSFDTPNGKAAYLSAGLCVPVYNKGSSLGGVWLLNIGSAKNVGGSNVARHITKMNTSYAICTEVDGNNGNTSFTYTTNGGLTWSSMSQNGLYENPRVISNGSSYVMMGKQSFGSSYPLLYYKSTNGSSWTSFTPTSPTLPPDTSDSGFWGSGGNGDYMSGYYYKFINEQRYYSYNRNSQIIYVYRSTDMINWSLAYGGIDLGYHTSDESTYGSSFYKLGNLLVLCTSGWWEYTMVSTDNGVTWTRAFGGANNINCVDYNSRLYIWTTTDPTKVIIVSSSGMTTYTINSSVTPSGIGRLSNKFVILYPNRYDIMSDIY